LAAALRERFDGIEVDLVQSSGGAFEVRRDDDLVFSKLQKGRFPEDDEVFASLAD
jgi:selT/selW/selH-like putative selenoprotein